MSTARLLHGRYGAACVGWEGRVYVFGGAGKEGLLGDVEAWNVRTGNVAVLPWKLVPRRYHQAVVIGDTVFIAGGTGRTTNTTEVERIELRTGAVAKCRPVPTQHINAAFVVSGGLLWLIGGAVPGGFTGAVHLYDPKADTWETGPPLPTPRECSGVVHGGLIHIIGGYAGKDGMNTWDVYSLGQGRWFSRPDLPFPISAHHMAVVGNTAYSFGDYAVPSRVIACDLRGGQWAPPRLAEPYIPRRHAAVAALDGIVYVVGGNIASTNSYLDVAQSFRVTG